MSRICCNRMLSSLVSLSIFSMLATFSAVRSGLAWVVEQNVVFPVLAFYSNRHTVFQLIIVVSGIA
eukprot:1691944-Amphidinium_carterae.2